MTELAAYYVRDPLLVPFFQYIQISTDNVLFEMNRILPITARLRSKLIGNMSVADCASEIIQLAPAVDREQPAAIALPSEFDRVLAVQEETTLEHEHGRLGQGKRRHGPTLAYRLDNAILAQGSLYFDGGHIVFTGGSSALLPRRQDRYAEMQLCTNYFIERYFGHWLFDGLALQLLADQTSLQGLVLNRKPWPHEPEYRKIAGTDAVRTDHALVGRLWVINDHGINENRIARIQRLRSIIRNTAREAGPKKVMLVRGITGAARNLVNSNEVHDALEKLGFEIICPERETVRRIVDVLSSAEIAIVVEGSVQSHCAYAMPVGSTLLTIQPPARFNAVSKDRCDAVGLNWGFVVADPHEDGFFLPIDRLMRTLDEVSRVTGGGPTA